MNPLAARDESNILLRMKWFPLALAALLFALAACDLARSDEPTPVSVPATPDATSSPTASAPLNITPVITEAPPVTRSITLTLWTNTEIAPNNDVPGGSVLLEQLSAFDNDHSNISMLVELKTIADQGGTLSYLRTGRTVAPDILPDVVLLPAAQLRTAANQGLIFPLDGLIDQEAIDDLFPVARELAVVDEQLYGYPFALTNLQHVVYSSSSITQTVSANWSSLVEQKPGSFIYPAAGAVGAEVTAHFYQQLGGSFADESGQPQLQLEPLVSALDLIQRGVAQGFIDPQSGGIATTEEAWQIFQESPARIVQTTASYFLGRRAVDNNTELRVAPLPGPDGALPATVGAWTWTISTSDPERQEVAAALINWLATPANSGAWSLQSYSLPARASAFNTWPEDSYTTFLQRQAAVANPLPTGLNSTILTALSDATTAVILGLSEPTDAAEQALSALTP